MNLDSNALVLIRDAAVEAKRGGRGTSPPLTRLASVLPAGMGLTFDFDSASEFGMPLVILRQSGNDSPVFRTLSPREREVASLLSDGLRNKEIASALCISVSTVKDHVHHILTKTGLSSRAVVAAHWRKQPPPPKQRRLGVLPKG